MTPKSLSKQCGFAEQKPKIANEKKGNAVIARVYK